MSNQIINIKRIQKKSLRLNVTPTTDAHTFGVQSGSEPKVEYIVTFAQGYKTATCTCKWMQNGGDICCHIMAAIRYLARSNGHRASFWLTEADAKRQHRRMTTVNGIWVTLRKHYKKEVAMEKEQKQEEGVATYICPECGDEVLAMPGCTDVYCPTCWYESDRQKLVACQEQKAKKAFSPAA